MDTSDYPQIDLREQLVRIDRAMAETHKLMAENYKPNRDPRFLLAIALAAGLFIVLARLPEIIHALRVPA